VNGKHARRMSMINRRLCCLTAVAMLLLSGCAQGGPVNVQDASSSGNTANTPAGPTVTDTGVGGLVTDADRTPVVMASVERAAADSSAPVAPLAGITGNDGRYFWALTPGTWDITVTAPRFATQTRQVIVTTGQTAILDFVLHSE
jgi:Carboxypeptidase regulatory-like domain